MASSYLLSTNRKAINWRLVTIGLFIQTMFAIWEVAKGM
ncbi:MAG: hypothetical protein IPO85_00110 [Saprospiraceae bacterium]|uniref:Concentrative nucleoside transporter N-terminal domain-containing protein n=1 Tax=Candidatus Defluviibacterium haderslevense TaxID=2981993 RepID=A0A9D7S6V8_9BACT|nr:hypothetical protein [Candidatus Defluviibacterium haderslevense]